MGDWAVQQCDFVRSTGTTRAVDWATTEKYRVENAVEMEPELWFASPEEAIKHHDAEFGNDWTSDSIK